MGPEVFHHYKTGEESLDGIHWAIIEKLNDAIAISYDGSIDNVSTLIAEALDLLAFSFAKDDARMIQEHYPYRAYHMYDHAKLVESLIQMKSKIENRATYLSARMVIDDWQRKFTYHIDNHDFQWIRYSYNVRNA